jgi:hypothetical protein
MMIVIKLQGVKLLLIIHLCRFNYYDVCVKLMSHIVAKCGKGKIFSTMALSQLGVELLQGSFHNLQVVTPTII